MGITSGKHGTVQPDTVRLFINLLKSRIVDIEFPDGIPPGGRISIGTEIAPRGKRAILGATVRATAKKRRQK